MFALSDNQPVSANDFITGPRGQATGRRIRGPPWHTTSRHHITGGLD